MAGLDYRSILDELAAVIRAAIPEASVALETETIPGAELCPFVACYLEDRVAPAEEQRLAAGKRTDLQIRFSVWSFGFSIVSLIEAKAIAWRLASQVEVAAMNNRTLNGKVVHLWLTGGALDLERGSKGSWVAGAEVLIVARAVATV